MVNALPSSERGDPPTPVEPDFEHAWRMRFEHFAGLFDDDAGIAGWSGSGLDTRLKFFLGAWRCRPEACTSQSDWLDAGCGAGTYTRLLAADGRRVTAVDYSIPSVMKAKQRAAGCDASWSAADVTRLPFPNECFDGALCFGVMQALAAPHAALRELRRVLRRGGVLWVDALNASCLPAAWSEAKRLRQGRPVHLRYDNYEAFVRALSESGFGAVDNYWVPITPRRLSMLQPLVAAPFVVNALRHLPRFASKLTHSMLMRAQVR